MGKGDSLSFSPFTRNLVLAVTLIFVLTISFWLYVSAEKDIGQANESRYQSYQLANELHQSSDELTRMARTYVMTGDPVYKKRYQDILDIRDGKQARPDAYGEVYWDLVLRDDQHPRPSKGDAVALLELMRQAGFTREEFGKLAEAKNNLDALTLTEFTAMRLIESKGSGAEANHVAARRMMFDERYHQAKASIMRPIDEFNQMLDRRTLATVESVEKTATVLRVLFVLLAMALLWVLWRTYKSLRSTLGGTLDQVQLHIAKIGSGDFSSTIPLASGAEESVLGWLSETQSKLKQLQSEREKADAQVRRINKLYQALSECNQAIVWSKDETELFAHICRDAVDFGGIKMAWIGLIDKSDKLIKPVSSFGSGVEYLEDIHISIDPHSSKGLGPTGRAAREDRPFWCQDFQHDPRTAPWHERGAKYGWGSSASLPLHRKGAVIGTFTLYADAIDAFDDEAKNLLIEMAVDISFALDRFALEIERAQIEKNLSASEDLYHKAFQTSPDAININRKSDGVYLDANAAFERITGWKREQVIGKSSLDIHMWANQTERQHWLDAFNKNGQCSNYLATFSKMSGECWFGLVSAEVIQINGEECILATTRDVTESKRMEDSLRKLSLAVGQSPNAIVITDLNGSIEYVNNAFLQVTGYTMEETIGQNPRILQSGKTSKETYDDMWAHLSAGKEWRGELTNKRKDGSEYIESAMIAPIRQADGQITNYLAIKENITNKKRDEEQIKQLAHFDQLTGLPNRALLNERFSYALSLAERSGENLAVMFLDLDHFKNINDTLGHTIGDQVLMEMARRLKACIRDEDTLSRLGGDEFIMVFPGTDAVGAAHVVGKLINAVSQPYQVDNHELNITPSIGIAIYPDDGADYETLFMNADTAMYRVKQNSRNDFRFFTAEMQSHTVRTLTLGNALRHAMARNELELFYQPQVAMQDGHIIGVEALLRWHHPELGMVSPAEFIPIAEDSGQIIQIGEWVLRTAIKQMKDWRDSGLPNMVIAVNLSAVQFRQPNLSEMVTGILDEIGLPHQNLELELTEAVAMDDPQAAIDVMDKLDQLGIRMSIDDFGTGYSSLNYLKKFKVYKLKIDQSFVRNITDDPEDKAIVTAIINLASSLGMRTIAEGVETADQLAFLRLQGCNEVQGYYFSKPLPAEQLEAFVR